ncbi:putative transcriptional regulator [Alloalcanivorax dieselolei B5]|uniref:Putative transcriptional regulator n=1 Tax=Alcanivorax dieselolei (strain DSM 16502 / CGMCC 1.3690 / MCCC 1A00001 / B-5) TaxID=930169 RepID=K0CIH1_ALCDB|nr:WYL domain-containing protein [Alloalcanivorax dieselolei]AFT71346.1 putative transcriptional regulator [Alloalcanivorax dieselolei B5]GGJ95006.1 WYL domain-containing protein [Alloalcanivorax dieselolei]
MSRSPRKSAGDWPLRWDLLLRYRLIEIIALWEGRLTTNHLMRAFGIGRQQASKDINLYLKQYAPGNLVYDRSLKGYRPGPGFTPRFTLGAADEYLQMVRTREDLACSFEQLAVRELNIDVLPVPNRGLRPEVLRALIQACRERLRLEIDYASLAHPEPEPRVIQPHTVVFSGYRWHVRGWCEKNHDYRDFVLSRIGDGARQLTPADRDARQDRAWQKVITVRLAADPRLDQAQQALIAADYGMDNGELALPTRAALVGYLLQWLRLEPTCPRPPEAQQIVLLNRDECRPWLIGDN